MFRPSTADTIIGSREGQRSTKTYIQTERSAIMLALVENHARGLVEAVVKLRKNEGLPPLDLPELVKAYPGCKKWIELHQQLVEHYASLEGFTVQAAVRLAQSKLYEATEHGESSILTDKKV